ncbi:cell adhesion molecule CEACAM5-like isoform X2 [Danio rerio]|uniref:Cell adhesion molecule CEACAM5-like isoform X2 n=1 Tax=Danio rerio TaxID=7955 RepID=A0AC58G307_DANRE
MGSSALALLLLLISILHAGFTRGHKPTVTVTPVSAVFTGETVNLTCVIESYSDWTYEWYKDYIKLQSDGHYPVNRDTLTIRGAAESDQGQYWCRGLKNEGSTDYSEVVHLSVKASPRSTVTVTPDSAVFTGETVNLTCVIESDHSDWTYEWYTDRNSVKLQSDGHYTVNRDTLTIRGAAESDQGQYWCRGQRSERPNSSQSTSAVNLSLKEPVSDVTYSEVVVKKQQSMDKADIMPESTNVTYSEIRY